MPASKKRPKANCRFVGGPKDGALRHYDTDTNGIPKERITFQNRDGDPFTYGRVMYRFYDSAGTFALYAPLDRELSAIWQALNQRYNPTDLTDALKRTNFALRKIWDEAEVHRLPNDAIQAALDAGNFANAVLKSYKEAPVPEDREFIPIRN